VNGGSILCSLNVKTARWWRDIVRFTHLAREGRMTVTIGRRELLAALGGAVAAWPRAARGQQPERLRRIGVLMAWPESDPEAQSEVASFVQELQKLGWTEGRDLRIDTRWWIPTDQESTHRFAKELVSLRPDVILSQGTSTTAALLRETRTIPIVFTVVADRLGTSRTSGDVRRESAKWECRPTQPMF
jgi:putative ABC transport system substrate-binding protein